MKNCQMDIRFREVGGKGWVTIGLQGNQVVKEFTPPHLGLAFIEGTVAAFRKGVEAQLALATPDKLGYAARVRKAGKAA